MVGRYDRRHKLKWHRDIIAGHPQWPVFSCRTGATPAFTVRETGGVVFRTLGDSTSRSRMEVHSILAALGRKSGDVGHLRNKCVLVIGHPSVTRLKECMLVIMDPESSIDRRALRRERLRTESIRYLLTFAQPNLHPCAWTITFPDLQNTLGRMSAGTALAPIVFMGLVSYRRCLLSREIQRTHSIVRHRLRTSFSNDMRRLILPTTYLFYVARYFWALRCFLQACRS